METSTETLIVAGTLVLTVGFLLGMPLARARMASPTASRHLVNTHLEALIAGGALLALSLAASYSTIAEAAEVVAAWLLIGGVSASLAGGVLNWLSDTEDQFAARTPGFLLQAISGPAIVVGGLLLSVGVLKAVFE